MILIWRIYKYYNNLWLLLATQNFFITLAIDNLAVKPIVFAITSFGIKNTHFVDAYI